MFYLIFVLLIVLAVVFFFGSSYQNPVPRKRDDDADSNGWEYGDVWKRGSPDDPVPLDTFRYTEILRGDTGTGYDDSYMLDLIGYLASCGIRATYDAVPLALEAGGAIKTYVLKVEAGSEDEAIRYLRERETGAG